MPRIVNTPPLARDLLNENLQGESFWNWKRNLGDVATAVLPATPAESLTGSVMQLGIAPIGKVAGIAEIEKDLLLSPAPKRAFGAGFSEDGKAFSRWVERNRNKSAIHPNSKTGFSLDFTTGCCNRAGSKGACAYCYVEHPRTIKKLGLGQPMAPKNLVETPYRGEIRSVPKEVVSELNRDGGLRHQSFSDWMPHHKEQFDKVLEDAMTHVSRENPRGLMIKTITKDPEFIRLYGNHPNVRVNLSIDELPRAMSNSVTLDKAVALKAGRKNIKIRSVALNEAQAIRQMKDPRIDVVTLYHGPTGDKLLKIVEAQNPDLVRRVGREKIRKELATWENMGPTSKTYKKLSAKEGPKAKMCCGGGKCASDRTKCGFGLGMVGMLIAGVSLEDD
jgi:hypothetical protein